MTSSTISTTLQEEDPEVETPSSLNPDNFSFVNERAPDGLWVGYFKDFPGIRHTSRSPEQVYTVARAALAMVLKGVEEEVDSERDITARQSQLNIRMTGYEHALLRYAADTKGMTISKFARTAMMKEAVLLFLDHPEQ